MKSRLQQFEPLEFLAYLPTSLPSYVMQMGRVIVHLQPLCITRFDVHSDFMHEISSDIELDLYRGYIIPARIWPFVKQPDFAGNVIVFILYRGTVLFSPLHFGYW